MSQDAKPKRVVVIGAGASGIGAARTLSAAGAEVIILEGRDRIGGRMRKHCLTKNLLKSSGLGTNANHFVNIQLGANWIHGMEAATNPMFAVAEALGLELHQTSSDDDPGDDVILFDSGDGDAKTADSDADNVTKNKIGFDRVTKEDYHESLSRYEWIKEYVDHIQFNYEKEDISLQAAFDLALQASESEIFGPCSAPQRRCLNWLYDRVSIDLGAHISQVSLNCYAEGVSDGQGGEALVKHIGYSGILDHLATEFPLDIRLGRHVASIALQTTTELDSSTASASTSTCEQKLPQHHDLDSDRAQLQHCALKDGRYVRITCTDGETYLADACVVTVPVGALQAGSIAFSPRAPSVITSVCASLKLGLMNLVWLWYPEVFWPEECNFLGVAREAGGAGAGGAEDLHNHPSEQVVKFSTFLVPPVFDNLGVRQPVLMCQIVGPYATTIESMTDADIAAEATSVLRAMFGAQQVPDAIGCAHSSWGSDPFARGSWSYFPYRTAPTGDGSGSVVASAAVASVAAAGAALSALSITSDSLQVAGAESAQASTVSVSLVESSGAGGSGSGMSHAATTDTTVLRPSSFPLRSVTISEAASMLSPRIRSAHSTAQVSAATAGVGGEGVYHRARRYSSDFGFTSDGSQDSDSEGCESTDSSDDDDDEEEAGVLGGHADTYTSTTTTPATAYCSSVNNNNPCTCTGSSSGTSSSSSSDEGVLTSAHQRARTDDELLSAHICYASEAMSVLNRGTVHGAYMSGIREATKILAFLEDRK